MQKFNRNTINTILAHQNDHICTTLDSTPLGYYQPTGANWAYEVRLKTDGRIFVMQFGRVVRAGTNI